MTEPSQRRSAQPLRQGHPRDIIATLRDRFDDLRPAEQAVASAVLADVRGAVEASNAEIARRAGVSEPTVTRFCRALGCEGVRDFKLQLARSLVVGDIYLDVANPVVPLTSLPGPEAPPLWNAVLTEARHALRAVETQLDPALVLQAAEILAPARQIGAMGLGGSSGALADETANRLFRYGLSVTPLTDPYLGRMHAASMKPGDVLIAISATGRTAELIEAVELARRYGAATIAVTTSDSALAQVADLPLTVRVEEYPDTLKPTAARYAFLAVIDLVAAATGYRIGPSARENLRRIKYDVLTRRQGEVMEPLGD
ncbi:MAG: MurR/RpiR family transcriptional regulator [Rubellimicrobium sp.]|nr:MurR/RpiR family transcriptional regulator [Rubellimicrobium sp.]